MNEATDETVKVEKKPSSNEKRTTLLLVGRAGNGKSSVGNSLLRLHDDSQKFAPRGPSEETRLKSEIAYDDQLFVVDCSGIGDTGSDMPSDMSSTVLSAFDALIINNNVSDKKPNHLQRCGFDALIFVLKYGVRFTKQEKDAVEMVKSVFGDDVFRLWGILVFSYGDNFKTDIRDIDKSFDNWCREQRGEIKTLFEEVRYRCVLFDNKTKDKDKLERQRCKLTELILTLNKQEKPDSILKKYFPEDFTNIRAKHFNERCNRLDNETQQLLTILKRNAKSGNNKATSHLQHKLKNEWINLKREIKEEMEYFTLGENAKKDKSTQYDTKDKSTQYDTKEVESTQYDTKEVESTQHDTKEDKSTQYDTKEVESTQYDTKDKSTQYDTKEVESTQYDTKEDKS
ncbi:unnamed protein product, partial [Lymnaea stagnalis]